MSQKKFLVRLFALLFAFTLFAAACGDSDDPDDGVGDAVEDAADEVEDAAEDAADEVEDAVEDAADDVEDSATPPAGGGLDGIEISVASKDFTEQIVLGKILVQALEAEGATVDDQTDLGGTAVVREALLANEIDTYWEYNGTGWTVHLAQEEPSFDAEQLTEDVRAKDLEDNDIQWLGRSPFNDTYGFAASPDLAEANGGPFTLEDMSTYLQENDDATVCLETEFPDRPDGLVLFEDAYDYEVPSDQINIIDTELIYTETQSGECDFGEIFTTDGRIVSLGLSLVEDPGVFIIYNVSLTMPTSVYDQAPGDFDRVVDTLLDGLDEEKMTELNARVADGEDPGDVATDYLTGIEYPGV